jgi:UDP-2,3-diacylglucosamine pyrophosphatase LpxH
LLGRINDPIIGNPSEREVFFFIPDLHLLSPGRQEFFGKYSFNYSEEGWLHKLMKQMALLRESWDQQGDHKLVTIQLGDFFDMWREFPGLNRSRNIADDVHGGLRDVLYRGIDIGESCLKTTMILGNHDTDNGDTLSELQFRFKAFNRTQNNKPFLFVTHGDAFDILETTMPEFIKEFGVNFIGKLTQVNEYQVGNWGKLAAKINKPIQDLESAITEPEHLLEAIKGAPKVEPGVTLPDIFCETIATPEEASNKLFKKLYESVDYATEEKLPGQHVKVVATGHTHKASMIYCQPQNQKRPLILMDVGAWIEKCKYHLEEDAEMTEELTPEPSAQLGVIHGNDARIYQIRFS